MNGSRFDRLRRLENRPPDRPFSYDRLPDVPTPHHFYTHVFEGCVQGRTAFFSHDGLLIARMPWVPVADAALIFCSLPEGPTRRYRAIFETSTTCTLGLKEVSDEVVHCMVGVSPKRLLWRARIRREAKSLRDQILSDRWEGVENSLAGHRSPTSHLLR